MKKAIVRCAVLLTLAACAGPENFFYEVTERTTDGVSIQANKGNMKMQSEMVAQMRAHMDKMALGECQSMGKGSAVRKSQRKYTTGPYYSWIEQSYSCQ